MRLSLLLAAAPLVILGGCATAPSKPTGAAQSDPPPAASPYGLFLAGEAAMNAGRSGEAAQFFDLARAGALDNATVEERAFTAAVLAGDIDKAAALAPSGDDASEAARRLGRLVLAVKALSDGKGKDAQAQLAGENIQFPHKAAAALLAPWAAAQAGDLEGSLVRPVLRGDRVVDYFGQLGQAMLYERARRYDEAETDFKALTSGPVRTTLAAVAYGGFLERRGRRAEAAQVYAQGLERQPGEPSLTLAKARAESGKPAPPVPSLRTGAAQAILGPASEMVAAKQNQFALAYLRLALRLDPKRDEAWVMVGDVLSGAGDNAAAREAYENVKPGSEEYGAAQAKLAWTYQGAGDKAMALKLARAGAATGQPEARMTLADLLRADEQYAEASEVLSGLIAESKSPDWRLLYARGVSYERLGRWPEAERDLEGALKLAPEEPELLNYLGYSWIDRGERLKEAMGMVERAVASDPRSGAMVDSLGWAYYRLGDYGKAVEKLEEAVELEAGDPEINNHLGDAYWKTGRRDEALFQWRRVLTLQPEPKIKANAEAKIASGAGPDGPPRKVAGE